MYFFYRLDKLFSRLAIHNHPYSLGAAQNESYATSLFVLSQHPPAQHHMMIMNVEEVAHRWTEEREKLTWSGSIGIRAQMPVLLRCRLADSLWERERKRFYIGVVYCTHDGVAIVVPTNGNECFDDSRSSNRVYSPTFESALYIVYTYC